MNSSLKKAIFSSNYARKLTSPSKSLSKDVTSRETIRGKSGVRTEEYKIYFNNLEQNVDYNILSETEKEIHRLHKIANDNGKFTYKDPESGLKVISGLYHYLRGKCCGNACRHCPYEHTGVPEAGKCEKKFNSAFYVSIDNTSKINIDPTLIPRKQKH